MYKILLQSRIHSNKSDLDRYAESEASFTQAIEAEDPKLQSLALERYASFQYLKKDMDGSLESLRLVLKTFCVVELFTRSFLKYNIMYMLHTSQLDVEEPLTHVSCLCRRGLDLPSV